MNDLQKGFKRSVWVYIAQFVQIITSFLLSIILVRGLSQADYGAYSLISSILVVATYFSLFGIEQIILRYIPEFIAQKRLRSINKLLGFGIVVRLFFLLIFVILTNVFKEEFFAILNLPEILAVWYGIICLILIISGLKPVLGTALLSAYLKQHIDSLNLTCYNLLKLIFFFVVLKLGYGLPGVILSYLLVELLSFSHYFLVALKEVIYNRKAPFFAGPKFEYRRIFRFGLFSSLATSTAVFREIATDNLVIAHYLGAKAVAVYAVGAFMVTFASRLSPPAMLRGVLNPLLIKQYAERRDIEYLKFSFEFLTKLSIFYILPAFCGLVLLSREIVVNLYNIEYLESLPVLYILAGFFIFGSLSYPFGPLINTLEKTELSFVVGLFAIYNLVMDIILVKYFGITGAAIATGSTGFLVYFYYWAAFRWYVKLKLHFPFIALIKTMVNLIPMALFVILAKPFIQNIISLILVVISGAAIYIFMSWKNKIFSERERDLINRAIGRRLWIF